MIIFRFLKLFKKIHKFLSVVSYFTTRSWNFKSYNAQKLCARMSEKDRELFFCNLRDLDWSEFFDHYMLGIRTYLLKDPESTLPAAKVRYNRYV